jgi:hypothetical protein
VKESLNFFGVQLPDLFLCTNVRTCLLTDQLALREKRPYTNQAGEKHSVIAQCFHRRTPFQFIKATD